MNPFVKIHPLFANEDERNIDFLSAQYADIEKLKRNISQIIGDELSLNAIKGKRILLKPNWVTHSKKVTDAICLRTHDNFLLAALELLLQKQPSQVTIGDAPIQGCKWDKMLSEDFLMKVNSLSSKYKIPILIKDFRRATFEPYKNNPLKEQNPLSDYIIFDLGKQSYLEPITRKDKKQFRVTNYNPDRLAESHCPGVHKYCITKELFDADVVISLPKVKTHQKAGITAALKNLVGINGDKDFLPHHRIGGTGFGGDCYPGNNILRYCSELMLDYANRRQGKRLYWVGYYLSIILWKLSRPENKHSLAASWHGNDTTWRMVLDLNKIAVYGKSDGTLAVMPQRQLFSLCDGIVGGQGDGPLKPDPLPLGIISFTNHSGMNDIAIATLMGFDIDKISLVNVAYKELDKDSAQLFWNNYPIEVFDLKKYAIKTICPPGWYDYLK